MMHRLTFEGNFCEIARCKEVKCPYDTDCSQKQVWERLKQHEDSGLSPEDAANLHAILRLGDGMTLMRLRELAVADQEGRVIVLPCKEGTTVYCISLPIATYPDKSKPEVVPIAFTRNDLLKFGSRVFLTREEAEKALAEMEGKG
mgnify:CR=1 FL=1